VVLPAAIIRSIGMSAPHSSSDDLVLFHGPMVR
jgi:hypothetical protein